MGVFDDLDIAIESGINSEKYLNYKYKNEPYYWYIVKCKKNLINNKVYNGIPMETVYIPNQEDY